MVQYIDTKALHAHPGNPRLAPREDVVEQIAAQLNGKFDEAFALIVRPNAAGYEIISGHHRKLAAERVGIKQVPCWVREMSDGDAYMALVLSNAQGELTALERGMHALNSRMDVKAYAESVGRARTSVQTEVEASRVASTVMHVHHDLSPHWRQLREIHAAAQWAWPALVEAMLDKGWTVEVTRKQAAKFKPASKGSRTIPSWIWLAQVAEHILDGKDDPIPGMLDCYAKTLATIKANELKAPEFIAKINGALKGKRLLRLSELLAIVNPIIADQAELVKNDREAKEAEAKAKEAQEARIARLRDYCSLKEWNVLNAEDRQAVMLFTASTGPSFNKQENADIEWAQWSWNPITGCLHDCPYCYARDIALQKKMEEFYPHGFEPTLRPIHLTAPRTQKPPKEAMNDARYRNVFTGSMADIFGRWVPDEWIKAVLAQMRAAPQWNFLCLTKFPKRMAEFDIPPNTWMGTTVDLQARVPAAEAAFARVNAAVKWLSIEPMLEPLTFENLDLFDWMVVGGSSAQSKTPEWHPPSEWLFDLRSQAKSAGVAWYEKSNLYAKGTPRTTELPMGLPVIGDNYALPDEFKYLGRAKTVDQKAET